MVTLVLVKNPFSPQDGREVKQIEAGKTLAELMQEILLLSILLLQRAVARAVKESLALSLLLLCP